MKKKFLALLMESVMMLGLAACTSSSEATTEGTDATTEEGGETASG